MAEKKKAPASKRQIKKTVTVRERAEKASEPKKVRRIRQAGSVAATPFKAAHRISKKEFNPIKMPDNRLGRFLTKRRSLIPSYFKNSWREVRQVVWPNRRDTIKMTIAVFVFAVFFGLLIALVDYGLDKLFKQFILK